MEYLLLNSWSYFCKLLSNISANSLWHWIAKATSIICCWYHIRYHRHTSGPLSHLYSVVMDLERVEELGPPTVWGRKEICVRSHVKFQGSATTTSTRCAVRTEHDLTFCTFEECAVHIIRVYLQSALASVWTQSTIYRSTLCNQQD